MSRPLLPTSEKKGNERKSVEIFYQHMDHFAAGGHRSRQQSGPRPSSLAPQFTRGSGRSAEFVDGGGNGAIGAMERW